MEASSDRLARLIAERCFNGCLPAYPNEVLSAVILCVPCLRDATEADAQAFANSLFLAIVERVIAQVASSKAEIAN
jgi:hypothetical protein